jgi:hypothetical protein
MAAASRLERSRTNLLRPVFAAANTLRCADLVSFQEVPVRLFIALFLLWLTVFIIGA